MSNLFYNAFGKLTESFENNDIEKNDFENPSSDNENENSDKTVENFSNQEQEEEEEGEEEEQKTLPKMKDQDFLALDGNLVLKGLVQAKNFVKEDGTEIKEVPILKDNYILPKDVVVKDNKFEYKGDNAQLGKTLSIRPRVVRFNGIDFQMWDDVRGGKGKSPGRALVHLGSGNKASSKLVLNYGNDFPAGAEVHSKLKVRDDIDTGAVTLTGKWGQFGVSGNNPKYLKRREYLRFAKTDNGSDGARMYAEGPSNKGKLVLGIQDDTNNDDAFIIRGEKHNNNKHNKEVAYFASNGRVGINGITKPETPLHSNGSVRASHGKHGSTDLTYYGVQMNRPYSYLRPNTDSNKILNIGYFSKHKWKDIRNYYSNEFKVQQGKDRKNALTIDKNRTVKIDGKTIMKDAEANNIYAHSISRNGGDWLRINSSEKPGRTALYGNLSINATRNNHGGLSVGAWKSVGNGNIEATGTIKAGGNIETKGTLSTGGHAGIGTTTPSNVQGWNRVLEVKGNAHAKSLTSSSLVKVGVYAHNTWGGGPRGVIGTETDHDLSFHTKYAKEAMRIKKDSKIGMGTTKPVAKLHIKDKTDGYKSLLHLNPNTGVSDTNIYSLSFGDGTKENNSKYYTGMGLIPKTRSHFSKSQRVLGTHMAPDCESTIYSNGWDKLFSVEGKTGNAYHKGSVKAKEICLGDTCLDGDDLKNLITGKLPKTQFRYVHIKKNGTMNLAQILVYDNKGVNVAKGKTVTASSNYGNRSTGILVNGNTTSTTWGSGRVYHTNNGSNEWIRIDLGKPHKIKNIQVYNRTDCCQDRITGAILRLSNEPNANTTPATLTEVTFPSPGKNVYTFNF